MTSFPLAHAALCIDCEAVFRVPAQTCPLCTSPVFVPLAAWLSRRIEIAPSVQPMSGRAHVRGSRRSEGRSARGLTWAPVPAG